MFQVDPLVAQVMPCGRGLCNQGTDERTILSIASFHYHSTDGLFFTSRFTGEYCEVHDLSNPVCCSPRLILTVS